MIRPSWTPVLISLTLAGSLASSCVDIPDLPAPVTGQQWCLDAEPAAGLRLGDLSLYPITHPMSGVWMRGCRCYCPEEHDIMLAGANGQLVADSADDLFYQSQVSLLRADAQLACAERVIGIQDELGVPLDFGHPDTVTCADAVADEEPYYATECPLDTALCPSTAAGSGGDSDTDPGDPGDPGNPGGTSGSADDISSDTSSGADDTGSGSDSGSESGGAMVYGLEDWSEVIHCDAPGECDIEAAFVDLLLEDLAVFTHDAIRVRPDARSSLGHRGFLLTKLGPQSLPAALGLRQGDLLWQINGIELRDFEAVTEAFEQLHQAPVLTLALDRDGRTLATTTHLVAKLDAAH